MPKDRWKRANLRSKYGPAYAEKPRHKHTPKPIHQGRKNYYAVFRGRKPGVYASWEECSRQVTGFPKAWYKGFETKREAKHFAKTGETLGAGVQKPAPSPTKEVSKQPLEEKDQDKVFAWTLNAMDESEKDPAAIRRLLDYGRERLTGENLEVLEETASLYLGITPCEC